MTRTARKRLFSGKFGAPPAAAWYDARALRFRFLLGKWLIALLITLCLGLQVLEATGRA